MRFSTRGRSVERGTLIRKRLNHDAIPTVWSNLPKHLSKVKYLRLTKLAISSTCEMKPDQRTREKEQEAQEKDSFSSILELRNFA